MAHTRDNRPAPLCPLHGVSMLVRRTVGELQYRYCSTPGCQETTRTTREVPDLPPAPAPPPEQPAARPVAPPALPRGPRTDAATAIGARHVPRPIVNRAIKGRLQQLAKWRTSQTDSPGDTPGDAEPTDAATRGFADPRRR